MLPPEYYELLQRMRDHQRTHAWNQDPEHLAPTKTLWERCKTIFFVSLLAAFVLVFFSAIFHQKVLPWFGWFFSWFN